MKKDAAMKKVRNDRGKLVLGGAGDMQGKELGLPEQNEWGAMLCGAGHTLTLCRADTV